jgi:hypothetical protein
MATTGALPCYRSRSDAGLARGSDNPWNDNKLTHKAALQVPQHSGVLLTLDLHLELWYIVDSRNCRLADDGAMIIEQVNCLYGIFKSRKELGRLLAQSLRKLVVEVL